jgi:hypothetical protein
MSPLERRGMYIALCVLAAVAIAFGADLLSMW